MSIIRPAFCLWAALILAGSLKGAPIVGWVLEAHLSTGITYSTPDPDYSHFLTATVQPLYDLDLFVANGAANAPASQQAAWWALFVPFTTFDCRCTVFDPARPVAPEPNTPTVPEPSSLLLLGLGMLAIGFGRKCGAR